MAGPVSKKSPLRAVAASRPDAPTSLRYYRLPAHRPHLFTRAEISPLSSLASFWGSAFELPQKQSANASFRAESGRNRQW